MSFHSSIELEFENVGFKGEGKTGVPGEKHLGAEYRTNNKQPTYDAGSGNRTRDTLVGGERSHCAIPARIIDIYTLRRIEIFLLSLLYYRPEQKSYTPFPNLQTKYVYLTLAIFGCL